MSEYLARPRGGFLLLWIITSLFGLAGVNPVAAAQNAAPGQKTEAASGLADEPAPADSPLTAHTDLPDAPAPAFPLVDPPAEESSSLASRLDLVDGGAGPWEFSVRPNSSERIPLNECPTDKTHARECRVHWAPLF